MKKTLLVFAFAVVVLLLAGDNHHTFGVASPNPDIFRAGGGAFEGGGG